MGRPKGSKNKNKVEEVKEVTEKKTKKCSMCGEEKPLSDYYKSYSVLFEGSEENRIYMCKECVLKYIENIMKAYNNERKALLEVCNRLDAYYDLNLFDSLYEKRKNGENVFRTYFTKINSLPQYRGLTFESSPDKDINNEKIKEVEKTNEEMAKMWGKSYTFEELNFLEEHYAEWEKHNDCEKFSVQKMIKMICEKELEIEKAKLQNKSTEKLEKAYLNLLESSSLTPKTMSALNETDSAKIYGMWVKDIERYRPAEYFEDKKLYKDFDGLLDYLNRFVFRPLKNLLTGSREFDSEFNVEDDKDSGEE